MEEVVKGLWVKRDADQLVITWRRVFLSAGWFTEGILFGFGAAFLVISVPRLLAKFSSPASGFQGNDVFTLIFLLLGILLLYRTLALFTNIDRIEVGREQLKTGSGPLIPWDGPRDTLPVGVIERVETQVISTTRGKTNMRAGTTITYSVCAILSNGSTRTLISGSSRAEPMYFIGNEVNRHLQTIKGSQT